MGQNSSFKRSLEAMRAREREQEERNERLNQASGEAEDWQEEPEKFPVRRGTYEEEDDYEYVDEEPAEKVVYVQTPSTGKSHNGCFWVGIVGAVVFLLFLWDQVVGFNFFLPGMVDTEVLATEVEKEMNQELRTKSELKEFGLRVKDLELVYEDGNKYSGMVTVVYKWRDIENNKVEVVYDGNRLLWEIQWSEELNNIIYQEQLQEQLQDWKNDLWRNF